MTYPKHARVLTGITPSGTPHLGNYVGSIRAAVRASRQTGIDSFFFLADYHGLIKSHDPAKLHQSTLEIAASWLAAGLDPDQVTFYRQSDIPEIPQLTWLLACVTGKGLLNRAHAYKAMLDKNAAAGAEPDNDVTTGLFMYPVLMAADILMFKSNQVPVGRDQIQHIEMARDIAASFNHLYGQNLLTAPEALIDDNVALLPGSDGRKMSKSYGNTIALFDSREQLRRDIMAIVTDSRAPGEAKNTENSIVFTIYRAFADAGETTTFASDFANGIAWGDAKQKLFERIDHELSPMRERYQDLMAHPDKVETILLAGAEKARAVAAPLMHELRAAVGLRPLATGDASRPVAPPSSTTALPSFKQYRENGLFFFKLASANGATLLQSRGFESPREAGQLVKRLQAEGAAALDAAKAHVEWPEDQTNTITQALEQMREAQEAH